MTGISIIVCCYNSSERIRETLYHISIQKIEQVYNWEIILVDNNCTDTTIEVALSYLAELSLEIDCIIIHESRPGLSFARNAGAKKSKYETLIFCDDDNHLANDFVLKAFKLMEAMPNVGALGGKSIAKSEVGYFPSWFYEAAPAYAVGEQLSMTGDASGRQFLWGSCLVVRRKLFLNAYQHLPFLLSDRQQSTLTSGGDSELCIRILLMGYKLYYDESLIFNHFIPEYRLSEEYRDSILMGHQRAWETISKYWNYYYYIKLNKIERIFISIKKVLKILIKQVQSKPLDTDFFNQTLICCGLYKWVTDKDYKKIHHFYISCRD